MAWLTTGASSPVPPPRPPPPRPPPLEVRVRAGEGGVKLDKFLSRMFPSSTSSLLFKSFRKGRVRVRRQDGAWERVKVSTRVAEGDVVRVPAGFAALAAPAGPPAPPPSEQAADAARALLPFLRLDERLAAVCKPAGLPSQGGTGHDAGGRNVAAALPLLGLEETPRIVHRLDKDTSGVLLLGRTREAAAELSAMLAGRRADKTYWAVVAGVPARGSGTIDMPLRAAGGRVTPGDGGAGDRESVTAYATLAAAEDGSASLLAMRPRTGRKHQLRAHAANALGCPVLGDMRFRKAAGAGAVLDAALRRSLVRRVEAAAGVPRAARLPMFLHCRRMTLPPEWGAPVVADPCERTWRPVVDALFPGVAGGATATWEALDALADDALR